MSGLLAVLRFGRPAAPRLLLAILAGAGAAACSIGLAATSAWLIARAAEQPPMVALLLAITGVRAFGIGRGVLRYGERLAAHDAAFRVLGELRAVAYARLARLAPAGLAELRSGDLLARLVGDVDGLADLWLRVLLPGASAGIAAVGAALLVGGLLPVAGLALALSVVVTMVGGPLAAGTAARRAEQTLAPARGTLAALSLEVLRGAPELIALGAVPRALAAVEVADGRLSAAERRSAAGSGAGTLVAALASGAAVWISLLAGIAAVRAGSLSGVALAVVVLTPLAVHEIVAPLAPSVRLLPGLASSADRVMSLLGRPDPVAEPAVPEAMPPGPLGLIASGLRVRYPGADRDALGPVDLHVAPGARLIVTGPSGSGKSTFAAACLRFLAPAGGSLALVDAAGRTFELDRLDGDDVRSAIGLCEQDPHVFDGTLGENVRLARPTATTGELHAALAAAGLDGFVRRLPAGLDTLVGERAARLSGGQRQRLALARALLADVRILILDEPTEHLDDSAAARFVAELPHATAGRTLLVLTHRPELFDAAGWTRGPEMTAVVSADGCDALEPALAEGGVARP
jgi:thiol reductant ABC exporter CydC subunit